MTLTAAAVLATANPSHSQGLSIICAIVLVAAIIGIIVGLGEIVGVLPRVSNRVSGGSALIIGVVLLVVWLVFC